MNETTSRNNAITASLWIILQLSLLLLWLNFFKNGYFVYRGDHVGIAGYFLTLVHPEFLRGDWFFSTYLDPVTRLLEIKTMLLLSKPFGLLNGILVFFVLNFISLVWAWLALGKRLSGSLIPGLLAMVMCIMASNMEIGVQTLFDTMKESRVTAAAFASWGMVLLLSRHYVFSGILMGLAVLAHSTAGPLFLAPFLLWYFFVYDHFDWKVIGKMLVGIAPMCLFNIALLYPAFFIPPSDAPIVSEQDQFDLLAKVHIPYLMSPMSWGFRWRYFGGLAFVFVLTWMRTRNRIPWAWVFGKAVLVAMMILAVFTVWIEVVPSLFVMKLQPYRISMFLYPSMFMVISVHLVDLWGRDSFLAKCRALILVLGLLSRNYLIIGIVEMSWELLTMFVHRQKWWGGKLTACLLPLSQLHTPATLRLSGRWMRILTVVNCCFVGIILSVIVLRPCTKEMQAVSQTPTLSERVIGTLAWKFQFEGCPVAPVERLAAWARENTPGDAVFLYPFDTDEQWLCFASRSSVFIPRLGPWSAKIAYPWGERYLALCGIDDRNSTQSAELLKKAMSPYGMDLLHKSYRSMSPSRIVELANRFNFGYIVTPVIYDTHATSLTLLKSEAENRFTGAEEDDNTVWNLYSIARN